MFRIVFNEKKKEEEKTFLSRRVLFVEANRGIPRDWDGGVEKESERLYREETKQMATPDRRWSNRKASVISMRYYRANGSDNLGMSPMNSTIGRNKVIHAFHRRQNFF